MIVSKRKRSLPSTDLLEKIVQLSVLRHPFRFRHAGVTAFEFDG